MATYFHGNSSHSQIQASASAGGGSGGGGLQTLILMNPTTTTSTTDYNNVAGYSDTSTTTTLPPVFLNSNCGGGNSFNAPPPSSQQFPFASAATSSEEDGDNNISLLHGFLPRVQQYNNHHLYNNNQKVVVVDHMEARENPHVQRGLSLSLSSQLSAYGAKRELPPSSSTLIDDMRVSASTSGGMQQNHHVLLCSKYLKAAQQLLDDVVNVVDSVTIAKVEQPPSKAAASASGGGEGGSGCENGGKRDGELTTAEKQEIHMKKAKLVNMLDEVEQRYRQYQQQMQMVATMFEEACGIGSAKAYTALALQTISKQFRSIKDAILCQVRIASKSLGEEDEGEDSNIKGSSSSSSSRMKNIDNQMRQQRALQQLGMIHHNAWRPQRGLPERSVSVLRSWLFQHFLHPYPKDSDKIMLAKQAGLTRGQVSNWFINARVRLWKPMVEEMYSKEMKEQEKKTLSDEKSGKSEQTAFNTTTTTATDPDKTSTMDNQNNGYDVLNQDFPINHQNITHSPASMSSASQARIYMQNQTGHFDLIGSPEMESISKKQRCTDIMFGTPTGVRMDTAKPDDESDNEHLSMKFDTEKQRREDGFTLFGGPTTHFINGGFNTYPIAEQLGRFNNNDQQFPSPYSATNNGVSLSLGLPHCENLAMSGPHQTFELARGVEDIGDARDFGSIPHRVIVPEYMRESTFRNARGLMDNYYQTL